MRSGWREVRNRRTFAKEFRIGDDIEEGAVNAVSLNGAPDPLVGVDRNGALFHNNFVAVQVPRDLAGNRFHIGQIGVAGFRLRCTDRDENGGSPGGGSTEIRSELHTVIAVALQQFRKVLFMDQRIAAL